MATDQSDLRERVKAIMTDGNYDNEEELFRDALDALDQIDQEKLGRWHEGNRVAIEQSRMGQSKPLDDKGILNRLRQRLKKEGIE